MRVGLDEGVLHRFIGFRRVAQVVPGDARSPALLPRHNLRKQFASPRVIVCGGQVLNFARKPGFRLRRASNALAEGYFTDLGGGAYRNASHHLIAPIHDYDGPELLFTGIYRRLTVIMIPDLNGRLSEAMKSAAVAFEPVIGLEIHARLLTDTKIFCGCSTRFGDAPNTNVCPVCLGLPGALPVLNRRAVDFAIKAALALNCTVQAHSIFARKNYFYPDLPKGYQISQYEQPLATEGALEYTASGQARRVGIIRVHMEEDAGKSLHEGFPDSDRNTHVDFNRSGTPLIEIVTHPDLRSADDAAEAFRRLREILIALGVNDGNMEEGSLRCDANVSVRPAGETTLGTKTEVKNINSFRFLEKALEYEIERQIDVLQAGGTIVQETRLWDAGARETFSMRSKEDAHDYRYFPGARFAAGHGDPDRIERIRASMVELPEARRQRVMAAYALSELDVDCARRQRADRVV